MALITGGEVPSGGPWRTVVLACQHLPTTGQNGRGVRGVRGRSDSEFGKRHGASDGTICTPTATDVAQLLRELVETPRDAQQKARRDLGGPTCSRHAAALVSKDPFFFSDEHCHKNS